MNGTPSATPIVMAPSSASRVTDHEACPNCGVVVAGRFCASCGERRASERDNSLLGFLREVFEALTSADRSFISTLRTLLTKPGELTENFMRGRRVSLMRPLQLFLLVNVAFFLWSTASNNHMFDTPLATHMQNSWHQRLATRLVTARLAARKTTLTAYGAQFN